MNFTPAEKLIDGTLIANPTGPFGVNHTSKYLDLNSLQKKLDYKSFLTTKFEKWKNEKEQRYIAARAENYMFDKKSVLQIIFGLRTSLEAKETIIKLVSSEYTSVEFKQVILAKKSFAIEIESHQDTLLGMTCRHYMI